MTGRRHPSETKKWFTGGLAGLTLAGLTLGLEGRPISGGKSVEILRNVGNLDLPAEATVDMRPDFTLGLAPDHEYDPFKP